VYQALLTRRYLFRRVIPLLAMLSVALCTAMVIVVLSVMGGFLEMVQKSGSKLIGDVAVTVPLTGFPHYEDLQQRLEDLPESAATASVVEAFGMVKIEGYDPQPAIIIGIRPDDYDHVTGYGDTMVWRSLSDEELIETDPRDLRHPEVQVFDWDQDYKEQYLKRIEFLGQHVGLPEAGQGAVLGVEINPYNERLTVGQYAVPTWRWLPIPAEHNQITIIVVPVTEQGGVTGAESRKLAVFNEFFVGRYDVDSKYVFVPFDMLQSMLKMGFSQVATDDFEVDDEGEPVLDDFGDPIPIMKKSPAKCTKIITKAADGFTADELKESIVTVCEQFNDDHPNEIPLLRVLTWEEQVEHFIGAVKKETALMTTLFSIISMVSIFLVLAIFWTIVQQKTRDIGILRAVGASRIGIAWLFLRYSLILGFVGAILGGAIAAAVVWNINPIHEFIGRLTGTYVWDPKVYYFSELPNEIKVAQAVIIMIGGMVFAVIGGLIPSIRAATYDPVSTLRYE